MSRPFLIAASLSGRVFDDPARAHALLQQVEAAGATLLLLGGTDDHAFDPLVAAAWAAPRTTQIGLIAAVPAALSHPFHVARALSAIDFLCAGRSGWSPVAGDAPAGMAEDMVGAARSLWDGWAPDALIIDKASGRYLDTAKVRESHYRGPFFSVRGPVNAMRPPQGHPLLVRDSAAGLADVGADLALVADGGPRPQARRHLVKGGAQLDPAGLARRFAAGEIDGVQLSLDDPAPALAAIAACRRMLPGPGTGATLRDRLGLALDPAPADTGAIA